MALSGIVGDHAYANFVLRDAFKGSTHSLAMECARESGLKVVSGISGKFRSGASASMLVLAASSCVVKNWGGKSIHIDVYTCGDEGAPVPAIQSMARKFGIVSDVRIGEIKRGMLPPAGILRGDPIHYKERPILNVMDIEHRRDVSDERIYNVLSSTIRRISGTENVMAVKHKFEPHGLTGIIGFECAGYLCHADLHTFPENRYSSITIAAPAWVCEKIQRVLEQRLPQSIRGDMSCHQRYPYAENNLLAA